MDYRVHQIITLIIQVNFVIKYVRVIYPTMLILNSEPNVVRGKQFDLSTTHYILRLYRCSSNSPLPLTITGMSRKYFMEKYTNCQTDTNQVLLAPQN